MLSQIHQSQAALSAVIAEATAALHAIAGEGVSAALRDFEEAKRCAMARLRAQADAVRNSLESMADEVLGLAKHLRADLFAGPAAPAQQQPAQQQQQPEGATQTPVAPPIGPEPAEAPEPALTPAAAAPPPAAADDPFPDGLAAELRSWETGEGLDVTECVLPLPPRPLTPSALGEKQEVTAAANSPANSPAAGDPAPTPPATTKPPATTPASGNNGRRGRSQQSKRQ